MKKLVVIFMVTMLLTVSFVAPTLAAPKGIDVNGFHYTLNILGKKQDWNANGDYDHGSTIFVPANSEEWSSFLAPDGSTLNGVKIDIGLGPEYMVTDGNGFDDGICSIELPKAEYKVYICMRGKPGFDALIKGWIYDPETDSTLIPVGEFRVKRNWQDATQDLLYVDLSKYYGAAYSNIYVLDLLDGSVIGPDGVTPITAEDYFWQYLSNGAKLVKVRIYPVNR